MTWEQIAWLVVTGAALGLGVRFFFAPNMQAHIAIIGGVVAVVAGPWLMGTFQGSLSQWSVIGLVVAVVAIVIVVGLARAAAERRRRNGFRQRAADVRRF